MTHIEAFKAKTERHPILVAVAAGLVAGAVSGATDRFFDRFVSEQQKRRERRVREGSAHQVAGPHIASKLMGRRLDEPEKRRARKLFGVAYGLGWGLIHGSLRKRFPALSRFGGLPFAIPFFFACDGFIAPLIGATPSLRRVPWQPSVKEMGNHIAWTATAELIHRLAGTARGHRGQG